jgi:dephospho-CoA kinase
MTVIGVIGMPGSGKEEFVQVALGLDYNVVRMGDIVREEYFKQEAAKDGITVGDFAHLERQRHGKDVWAVRTIPRIVEPCIIDGIRSLFEIERYRQKLGPGFLLINIDAIKKLRFQRLKARGREDAPTTAQEFDERDRRETGWGILDAIDASDKAIDNNGSLQEMRARSKAMLEELDASIGENEE